MKRGLKPGDPVIVCVTKASNDPGPRAQNIHPAQYGEGYSYQVEKYWIVIEVLDNGHLKLKTRRGKEHTISGNDPRVRPAHWWERWFYRNRFPALIATPNGNSRSPSMTHAD